MRPSLRRASRPAFSSTREVLRDRGQRHREGPRELADRGLGREARCARIARRVGSARAANVASRAAELLTIWLTISAAGRDGLVKEAGQREAASRSLRDEVYCSPKVFVRNTAICPRVSGASGQ